MANILSLALTSFTSYMTTELNSLADGSLKLGAAIDNNTSRNPLITWRLLLNTLTPASGGYVELYRLPGDAAGGNFAEGSDSIQPQSQYLAYTFLLRNASSAPYHFSDPIPCPPFSKWLVRNKAGVSLNASGSTLAYALTNLTVE